MSRSLRPLQSYKSGKCRGGFATPRTDLSFGRGHELAVYSAGRPPEYVCTSRFTEVSEEGTSPVRAAASSSPDATARRSADSRSKTDAAAIPPSVSGGDDAGRVVSLDQRQSFFLARSGSAQPATGSLWTEAAGRVDCGDTTAPRPACRPGGPFAHQLGERAPEAGDSRQEHVCSLRGVVDLGMVG